MLSPRMCGRSPPRARPGGRFERHLRRGDHARFAACEARIARLDRFAVAAFEQRAHRRGHFDAVALEDRERVGAGGRIGHRRAGRDVHRVVARHVGDQQRDHLRRMASRRKPPALDRREVSRTQFISLMVAPDLSSARLTACLSSSVTSPSGRASKRRAAAGDQAQHQIVGAQRPARSRRMRVARLQAGGVGHRMRRLDDLDALARHAVAVARDHQPVERAGPMVLDGPRHRRRRLAGADHDQAALAAAPAGAAAGSAPAAPRRPRHRTSCAATRGRLVHGCDSLCRLSR